MSTRSEVEGGASQRLYLADEDVFDHFLTNDLRRDTSFPSRRPRSARKEKLCGFEIPRPSSSGRFAEHLQNFSPSAAESGKAILNRLKNTLRKESDMFFHPNPELDYDMHSRKVDDSDDWFHKGFDDMRARHPMFRMPNWTTDDKDVSNLASRMSQSPHFSSMGRRGAPWRERRNSGGSAMSGTSEEDSIDGLHGDRPSHGSGTPTAVRIPIRIEAEAPPGYEPVPPQEPQIQLHSQSKPDQDHQQDTRQPQNEPHTEPQLCMGHLKKQPHYASKTTSAVDALKQEEVPRNTRCSSAPPDMAEPVHGLQRFVSKTTIIPQNSSERPLSTSPVFNNVAKPFVPFSHKTQETTPPIVEERVSRSNNENLQDLNRYPHQRQNVQKTQFHPQQQQQSYSEQSSQQQQQQPYSQYHQQQYSHPQQQYSQQPYNHQHQPQPHQHWENAGHKSSVVRNIPIILEGRDENKKDSSTTCESPPNAYEPQQHYRQQQSNRPQRESPFSNSQFGFGPSHSFCNQDSFFNFPSSHHSTPSHQYEQSHSQQPQQQFSHQPPHTHTHPQQPQPPQKEATPSPPPAEPRDIKMDKIASVRESVSKLQESVKNFEGTEKNKEFMYIDEMLTRALLQLDDIDPDGKDNVRQARRTLVKDINNTISALEKKVTQSLPETKATEKTAASDELEKLDHHAQEENPCGEAQRGSSQPEIPKPEEGKGTETAASLTSVESEEGTNKSESEAMNLEEPQDTKLDAQKTNAAEIVSEKMDVDTISSEAKPNNENPTTETSEPNSSPVT